MKNQFAILSLALALTSGAAQAAIAPINATHDTASPNAIETYFFKANSAGSSTIFLSSQMVTVQGAEGPLDLAMNGFLSVWELTGNDWVLVGANDEAPRQASNPAVNIYGVNVHQWDASSPTEGISDPGLTLNLSTGSTYMVVQSDTLNGPRSLSNDQVLLGALGQTIPVGSSIQDALWGTYDPFGVPLSGFLINPYVLNISGDVSLVDAPNPAPVPLPSAVFLFGSMLTGFGLFSRKKSI